jgi:hypothetical protein
MFSGPPLPLPHEFPLCQLLSLSQSRTGLGAWVRGCARSLHLYPTGVGRCSPVLISGDLGSLLRCCSQVAIREGSQPLVLESELLIQWRALQVVTGTPHLPCQERLKEIFPDADLESTGIHVLTQHRSPEEVLADCVRHGIPVAASRIIYRAPPEPHRPPHPLAEPPGSRPVPMLAPPVHP